MNLAWPKRFQDAATLTVLEVSSGLRIRCQVKTSLWKFAVAIPVSMYWVYSIYKRSGSWYVLAFVAWSLGTWAWNSWRDLDVELHIDAERFECVGDYGGGYSPQSVVPWSTILNLESRSGSGDEDEPYSPRGLWAVGNNFASCLLPQLNKDQALSLIEVIERHFPNAPRASYAEYTGLLKSDFISLNLSR